MVEAIIINSIIVFRCSCVTSVRMHQRNTVNFLCIHSACRLVFWPVHLIFFGCVRLFRKYNERRWDLSVCVWTVEYLTKNRVCCWWFALHELGNNNLVQSYSIKCVGIVYHLSIKNMMSVYSGKNIRQIVNESVYSIWWVGNCNYVLFSIMPLPVWVSRATTLLEGRRNILL
jgi:hypothetical protein